MISNGAKPADTLGQEQITGTVLVKPGRMASLIIHVV
jgi:hypothetical protein